MDFVLRRPASPYFLLSWLSLLILAGCHQSYSPNTYSADAAQQAAPVHRGVVIGVRQVLISSSGSIGAATGAAAGGITGAQLPATALGAVGGALVGTLGGAAAEKAIADTKGWEYIVQESKGRLVSVTQTSKTALPVGTHVLVIDGAKQARIIRDYTVQLPATPVATTKPSTKELEPASNQRGATAKAKAAPATSAAQNTTSTAATSVASSLPAIPTTSSLAAPAISTTTSTTPKKVTSNPTQAAPSLPADVTNDPILQQSQTSPTATTLEASASTTTETTISASSNDGTSGSGATTTQAAGPQ